MRSPDCHDHFGQNMLYTANPSRTTRQTDTDGFRRLLIRVRPDHRTRQTVADGYKRAPIVERVRRLPTVTDGYWHEWPPIIAGVRRFSDLYKRAHLAKDSHTRVQAVNKRQFKTVTHAVTEVATSTNQYLAQSTCNRAD